MVLDRINFLKDEINKANYKYYVEDNPSISDFEYDKMFAELKNSRVKTLFSSPLTALRKELVLSAKSSSHTNTNTAYTA